MIVLLLIALLMIGAGVTNMGRGRRGDRQARKAAFRDDPQRRALNAELNAARGRQALATARYERALERVRANRR